MTTNLLKKIFIPLALLLIVSCSNKFESTIIKISYPKKLIKIEGKHALILPREKFKLTKKFSSDDCESWSVEIPTDRLLRESVTKLIESMIEDLTIINSDSGSGTIDKNDFKSIILFEEGSAYATFYTQRSTAKFKIELNSEILVKGGNKEIKNNVRSDQTWEKNIFLGCELKDGSKVALENALENLLTQIHSSVYQSIYKITR